MDFYSLVNVDDFVQVFAVMVTCCYRNRNDYNDARGHEQLCGHDCHELIMS